MARPLRLEFPGALYHITARGNAQQSISLDDADRQRFIRFLGREIQQQHWRCYVYCLMDNHYHLVIETPEANLSRECMHDGRVQEAINHNQEEYGRNFSGIRVTEGGILSGVGSHTGIDLGGLVNIHSGRLDSKWLLGMNFGMWCSIKIRGLLGFQGKYIYGIRLRQAEILILSFKKERQILWQIIQVGGAKA